MVFVSTPLFERRSSPEASLWKAVVIQALSDVLSPDYWIRSYAIKWLFFEKEDFEFVCSLADVNPDDVREAAASVISRRKLRGRVSVLKRIANEKQERRSARK